MDNEKKSGGLKRIFTIYKSEFSKIVWPSRPELAKKTVTVVIISAMFGAYISLLDGGLGIGFSGMVNAVAPPAAEQQFDDFDLGDLDWQTEDDFEIAVEDIAGTMPEFSLEELPEEPIAEETADEAAAEEAVTEEAAAEEAVTEVPIAEETVTEEPVAEEAAAEEAVTEVPIAEETVPEETADEAADEEAAPEEESAE